MKDRRWAWVQRILNKLEQFPFINTIPSQARLQVILGSSIAALILFFMGVFFGARNRGLVGAVIGAVCGAIIGLFLGWLMGKILSRGLTSPDGSGRLEIQLDQTNFRYLLGDKVSGQVRVQSFIPLHSKGGKISLTCQGTFSHAPAQDSNKGTKLERETPLICSQEAEVIPPGDLRRGSVQGFAFNLSLPQLPARPLATGLLYPSLQPANATVVPATNSPGGESPAFPPGA